MKKLAFLFSLWCSVAFAQTSPNLQQGQVLTPAQWNQLFINKQDTLGYVPLNSAGGAMTGRLITAPTPNTITAGFNLTPGAAPSTPVNGDMWATPTGLFAQVNGSAVSLGSSSGTVQSVGLSLPAMFTVSGSPVTLTGTLSATLANQNANIVFAGPASGSAAAPTFRTLVNLDFPSGFVVAGTGLTGGSLAGGGTIAIDKATSNNVVAGASNKVLTSDIIYTPETTITFSATPTFDFSTFINAAITLTGNITSTTFSNAKAGQSGQILFAQDGTGSRTLPATLNTLFKFPGGIQPVLSTAPGAIDVIYFSCRTTAYCTASISKAFS